MKEDSCMDLVFTIRRADAKRALKEIQANRGREGKDDLIHVLVSEYAVTFRAVGTQSEWPVHGISPGAAQLPIPVLEKAIDMRSSTELQLRITDGAIFCGKASVRHGAIAVGNIPDVRISVPVNSSPFDLLVMERLLGERAMVEQGLASRLQNAKIGLPVALAKAAKELHPYGVSADDLETLIETAMREAEPRVKAALSA
jgi:hypothetical protein